MEPLDLLSMFLLGLLGTGHCLGMCGPLVLALPGGAGRGLVGHLAYHLGRSLTYGVVGAALAGVGAGLRAAASGLGEDPLGAVARLQVALSGLSALLLLALGLVRLGVLREPAALATATPGRLPWVRRLEAGALEGRLLPLLGLGLLLGLLPCGLSYGAFARTLSAPGALEGCLAALAFAGGTLPGLLALGTGASALARRHRRLFDLLAGLLLVGMAARVGVDAALRLAGSDLPSLREL